MAHPRLLRLRVRRSAELVDYEGHAAPVATTGDLPEGEHALVPESEYAEFLIWKRLQALKADLPEGCDR